MRLISCCNHASATTPGLCIGYIDDLLEIRRLSCQPWIWTCPYKTACHLSMALGESVMDTTLSARLIHLLGRMTRK
jgi:hypothetical protein